MSQKVYLQLHVSDLYDLFCNICGRDLFNVIIHRGIEILIWHWRTGALLLLIQSHSPSINSLPPERCGGNLQNIMSNLNIQNGGLCTPCEIAVTWMPQNLTNKKSTLVQVMAWCHQAWSHCLNQCWPRYGITRPPKSFHKLDPSAINIQIQTVLKCHLSHFRQMSMS